LANQLSVVEVENIVSEASVNESYKVTVTPEAYEACCVEIRNVEDDQLAWRKRSFEPDFETTLRNKLAIYA